MIDRKPRTFIQAGQLRASIQAIDAVKVGAMTVNQARLQLGAKKLSCIYCGSPVLSERCTSCGAPAS
jgi:hypothetical protein